MQIIQKLFILFLLAPNLILASGRYPSPLPTPTTEILNLDYNKCSTSCLEDYLKQGLIFSFMANFNEDNQNEELLESLNLLMNNLAISQIPYLSSTKKPFFNIALLFSRKNIGTYSASTTNVILSYLLHQNSRFNFEIFDSKSESQEDLQSTIDTIHSKGYRQIIAILTYNGANNLNLLNIQTPIFIPSVHSSQITSNLSPNIIYGGINYDEQIKELSQLNPQIKAASFYDSSYIGNTIHQSVLKYNPEISYSMAFNLKDNTNFTKEMKKLQPILNNSRIFLNTPLINSSIILSQITYYDIQTQGIYSTQINYNPTLLSITQAKDRDNMYIANSIGKLEDSFVEEAKLLNADLEYDWINYATALGIEYFYLKNIPSAKRFFDEKIYNNQVQYDIQILSPKNNRFIQH